MSLNYIPLILRSIVAEANNLCDLLFEDRVSDNEFLSCVGGVAVLGSNLSL